MNRLRLGLSLLLFPLTIWYGVAVALRNLLYDKGLLRSYTSSLETIAVGNLIMGGSGKTPHTEWLLRQLSAKGRVALLSRGYGRNTRGYVEATDASSAAEIGDEPLMIHRKMPHVVTTVCEERREGLQRLEAMNEPPMAVVLDDAYQHRQVRADKYILLTEYGRLYCDDHVLPFGNLREWRCGSRRADMVIVTKCPPTLSGEEQEALRHRLKISTKQKLFFSYISYDRPVKLFGAGDAPQLEELDEVLLVTGIAHPEPLQQYLSRQVQVTSMRYGDHHAFSMHDIEAIKERSRRLAGGRKAVVTTEKDASRLLEWASAMGDVPVLVIGIAVRFIGAEPMV